MTNPISRAASTLGKQARGKPKQFSAEELAKRSLRLVAARQKWIEIRRNRKLAAGGS